MAENPPSLELKNSLVLSSVHRVIKIPNLLTCSSHTTMVAYPCGYGGPELWAGPELTAWPASLQDTNDGGVVGHWHYLIPRIRLVAPFDLATTSHPLHGEQDLCERGGRVVRLQLELRRAGSEPAGRGQDRSLRHLHESPILGGGLAYPVLVDIRAASPNP